VTRALVEARGATFGYEGRAVVSGVNLTVHAGARVAVAGPNGGGKTTLFRGLLGLIPAQEGSVQRSTRRVGYVPQHEELDEVYPLTALEVVDLGALGRMRGANRWWRRLSRDDQRASRAALADVGLEGCAHRTYADLSGGQRQRVLIARALTTDPELLFLDEPTSGVDRDAAHEITDLLERLAKSRGVAVVMVGHQLDALRSFADRALWVAHGSVTVGDADELLALESLSRLLGGGNEVSA
jgi:ABC-type Mn2+/Zn2+ transport system ATPase subunit